VLQVLELELGRRFLRLDLSTLLNFCWLGSILVLKNEWIHGSASREEMVNHQLLGSKVSIRKPYIMPQALELVPGRYVQIDPCV
jgi:hypothetical protein